MTDNGRIKVYLKDGIPVGEIYYDGEIAESDISWMHEHILQVSPQSPCDLIVDKTGQYSLSPKAQIKIKTCMKDHRRVAFVIHHPMQRSITKYASISYLSGYELEEFTDMEQAISWLSA